MIHKEILLSLVLRSIDYICIYDILYVLQNFSLFYRWISTLKKGKIK